MPPSVAGAFVDASCPYASRGPWLQVFIPDDLLPTMVDDLSDLADPDEVSCLLRQVLELHVVLFAIWMIGLFLCQAPKASSTYELAIFWVWKYEYKDIFPEKVFIVLFNFTV